MIWTDLIKELDTVRSRIRNLEAFQKKPRSVVAIEVAEWLYELADKVKANEGPKVITFELDEDGKPIIPADLQGLFATSPGLERVANPNEGAKVTRRNPVVGKDQAPAEDNKTKATMLPRETLHINRPEDLEDADENTVAK